MKILILSWYFPPANDVAALRVGKMADYLQGSGHEVFVVTGDRTHADQSLPVILPERRIFRTPWFDVNHLRFSRPGHSVTPVISPDEPMEFQARNTARRRISASLARTYLNVVQIPDRQIGWLPYLKRAASALLKQHKFDLIYASGPPFSSFNAARALSRKFSVPWVAEYRDAWSRYIYSPKPRWRQAIDEHIENRVTPTAKGIIAVTEPWASYYRERFHLPTAAIYNGFDPESLGLAPPRCLHPEQPLSIVYVGALYGGLRDPSILYNAIQRSKLTPKDVQITYFGPEEREVIPLADRFGVASYVRVMKRVTYRESLKVQQMSDVLLLLQSPDDPRNVPAKVFEYFAARRPIIGLGLDEGIPARLLRERGAGIYHSDPEAVAVQLRQWAAEKKEKGVVPDLPTSVHEGLSRTEQFRKLDEFIRSLLR